MIPLGIFLAPFFIGVSASFPLPSTDEIGVDWERENPSIESLSEKHMTFQISSDFLDPREIPPELSLGCFKKTGDSLSECLGGSQSTESGWVWVTERENAEEVVGSTEGTKETEGMEKSSIPVTPICNTPALQTASTTETSVSQEVSSIPPPEGPKVPPKNLFQKLWNLVWPQKIRVRLTFYTGHDDAWGSKVAWSGVTQAKRGRTVAADPAIFPFGTWLQVPGFGILRVEDTGAAVKTRKASGGKVPVLDIYVGNDDEARRLATNAPEYVEVKVL